MKIGIASDHQGYRLKEKLLKYLYKIGHEVIDYGTDSYKRVDYPDYAFAISEDIQQEKLEFAIVICGSGIGISIACNKVKGIRCAKVDSIKDAKLARLDNDANILALNGSMPTFKAKDIVDAFLKTEFSRLERHERRIKKITEYENKKIVRKTKSKLKKEELKDER